MPIAFADKLVAMLAGLGPAHVEPLPPAERRRLADQCRRVIGLVEPQQEHQPKAGVLSDLRHGQRDE
jgi:hypothetical protein